MMICPAGRIKVNFRPFGGGNFHYINIYLTKYPVVYGILLLRNREKEEKFMSRTIYVVISQTGTMLSRILKFLTGAKYNHASISLVPDLETMYSFGRLHPRNPIVGGFVVESPHSGTFKRFTGTTVEILSLSVTEGQYTNLKQMLDGMVKNKKRYHYNYAGLFLAGAKIHYRRANTFYCSEFVKEMLIRGGIREARELADIVEPIHFLTLPNANHVYSGKLKDFASQNQVVSGQK